MLLAECKDYADLVKHCMTVKSMGLDRRRTCMNMKGFKKCMCLMGAAFLKIITI